MLRKSRDGIHRRVNNQRNDDDYNIPAPGRVPSSVTGAMADQTVLLYARTAV